MRDSGSFVRWQSNTATQLGYAINLMIVFATASFGFTFNLAKELASCLDPCTRNIFRIALVLLLTSIVVGAFCVLCRLYDFRKTTRIAKLRGELFEKGLLKNKVDNELTYPRCVVKWLDSATWGLFYIAAFVGGVLAAGTAICRAHIV